LKLCKIGSEEHVAVHQIHFLTIAKKTEIISNSSKRVTSTRRLTVFANLQRANIGAAQYKRPKIKETVCSIPV
jgi:hypothetical protein